MQSPPLGPHKSPFRAEGLPAPVAVSTPHRHPVFLRWKYIGCLLHVPSDSEIYTSHSLYTQGQHKPCAQVHNMHAHVHAHTLYICSTLLVNCLCATWLADRSHTPALRRLMGSTLLWSIVSSKAHQHQLTIWTTMPFPSAAVCGIPKIQVLVPAGAMFPWT